MKLKNYPDYESKVATGDTYDTSRVELAISVHDMQAVVHAKIGETLFTFLDGNFVARRNDDGDVEMHCYQLPAEA